MDELFEEGLEALALLDDGFWLGWSVGWSLYKFHADQFQHGLDSFFHCLALRRQVVSLLYQRL
jgi:hypothetical protein